MEASGTRFEVARRAMKKTVRLNVALTIDLPGRGCQPPGSYRAVEPSAALALLGEIETQAGPAAAFSQCPRSEIKSQLLLRCLA